jgi:predicted permease
VLLATVVGLGLNLAEVHMWAPLMTAIRMLGEVSIPLMMFALGVRLAQMTLAEFHLGLLIAVVRPVAGIALAYAVGWSLNLTGIQHAQLIVFGALPPAVLNYMFAERYSQEPEKVASMVLIGNVAALAFIPLALMFVLG